MPISQIFGVILAHLIVCDSLCLITPARLSVHYQLLIEQIWEVVVGMGAFDKLFSCTSGPSVTPDGVTFH